ncbi:MAG: phosphate signaling complex protein PhoU [Gammaproteobacteria bacterium]|nr:phosphate signaling complex protein PhoU [Gammaproteobacteria bacterium]
MVYQDIGQHISHQYDEDLESLRSKVLNMGGMVEKQVQNALLALTRADSSLAEDVATSDYRINAMEVAIDEECTQVIARRQPAASDLRLVVTVIKCITDLERIGDEAEKIGRHAVELAAIERTPTYFLEIKHLGDQVCKMLHDSLDALARMDVDNAFVIAQGDRAINDEYDALTRQLITYMMEDPRTIKRSLRVMWCARSLERIGDHAKNICEYVIYTVAGKDIRHTSFDQVKAELGNSDNK